MGQQHKATFLALASRHATLTYHRPLADFTGSVLGALMLSQLLYWHDDSDPWTKCTDADWTELLGGDATQYGIRQARSAMTDAGYLDVENRMHDGTTKTHYRLDMDALILEWQKHIDTEETSADELDFDSATLSQLLSVPPSSVTVELAMEAWNRAVDKIDRDHEISRVRKATEQRDSWVRGSREEVWPHMPEILDRIAHNTFLQGDNDRKWAVDFNWIWRSENNRTKLLEGNYDSSDTRSNGHANGHRNGHASPESDPRPWYLQDDKDEGETMKQSSLYADVGYG